MKIDGRRFLYTFGILWLLLASIVLANTNLDKQLNNIFSKYGMIGCSLIIVKGGSIHYEYNNGYSDLSNKTAISENSIFRIASLSKMFTAVALMQQFERGYFNLDDDLSGPLGFNLRNPNYPDKKITFKQVLTHTSGLIERPEALNNIFKQSITKNPSSLAELFSQYDRLMWSKSPPGEKYVYSNLGVGLLAGIIERYSGLDYSEYCRKYIFEPLNFSGGLNLKKINLKKMGKTYRYDWEKKKYKLILDDTKIKQNVFTPEYLGHNAIKYSPHGGIRASTRDLANLMIMLMNDGKFRNKTILNKNSISLLTYPHWVGQIRNDIYLEQGLILYSSDRLIQNHKMIGHSGNAYGLFSHFFFSPDQRFGIIFIINGLKVTGSKKLFYQFEKDIANAVFQTM